MNTEPTPVKSSPRRDALVAVTAIALIVTAIGQMFFVVPTYRRILEGVNAAPSLPARLAIDASRLGVGLIGLCFVAIAIGRWRDRKTRTGVSLTVLAACGFVAVLYLALTTWVYLDVARIMGQVR